MLPLKITDISMRQFQLRDKENVERLSQWMYDMTADDDVGGLLHLNEFFAVLMVKAAATINAAGRDLSRPGSA